jgi:MFS family permease
MVAVTQAPAGTLPAPPATLGWTVLALSSLAMFGNYYVYDCIAPLADLLESEAGLTDTQIGSLNAIYSLPNVAMVLAGGVIVDRVGAARACVLFAAVCFLGTLLGALAPTYATLVLGRLLFGLGAESLIVGVTRSSDTGSRRSAWA